MVLYSKTKQNYNGKLKTQNISSCFNRRLFRLYSSSEAR